MNMKARCHSEAAKRCGWDSSALWPFGRWSGVDEKNCQNHGAFLLGTEVAHQFDNLITIELKVLVSLQTVHVPGTTSAMTLACQVRRCHCRDDRSVLTLMGLGLRQ